MFVRVFLWLALSTAVYAIPYDIRGRGTAVPPTEDDFYTVPLDIDNSPPGTILKHRIPPAPIAAFGLDPVNLQGSYQILYRTNDNFGNATATVATILIPHNADYSKVLSYQVAQDSSFRNCAPSYALQLASASGGPFGTLVTQAELLLIEAALERGWVLIVPDTRDQMLPFWLIGKLARRPSTASELLSAPVLSRASTKMPPWPCGVTLVEASPPAGLLNCNRLMLQSSRLQELR